MSSVTSYNSCFYNVVINTKLTGMPATGTSLMLSIAKIATNAKLYEVFASTQEHTSAACFGEVGGDWTSSLPKF